MTATPGDIAPADWPQHEAPLPPHPSVEQLPAVPKVVPPRRSSIEVMLPTHGCLDSGDTTVQLLAVLYENFASQKKALHVLSAGISALRRGGTYVLPERDSTHVLDTRDFIVNRALYTKEVLATRLPVLRNVQELAFQYPYDPLFDTLSGIEDSLSPGERFPITTREYGRLTRYTRQNRSILVLELESREPSELTSDVTDFVPEFSGITDITTADYKTNFYTLGRQIGRISRVWADTEADRARPMNPAMLVSMGDVLGPRMPPELIEHCGSTARALGFTAMVPIGSELGLGPDKLHELASRYGLPLLASNLFRHDTVVDDYTSRPFPRFILQERDGLTIAFIGVVDPSELESLPTSVREQWRLEDMGIAVGRVIEELRAYLRRRPDLTILLASSRDPSALTRIEGVDIVIGPPVNSNIDPMRRVTEVAETPSPLEVAYGSGALIMSQPPWRAVTRITTDLTRAFGARRARPVRITEERTPVLEEGPWDPEIEKSFRVAEERTLIANSHILMPGSRFVVEGNQELEPLVWGDRILYRRSYRRFSRTQPPRYTDPLWMRLVTNTMVREMKSDIALSYNVPREWDIYGQISRDTVNSWLRTGDSVTVLTLTGLELTPIVKRLARQAKADDWPAAQVLFSAGLDPVSSIIRGRALDVREQYRVAVAESVMTSREFADVFATKTLPPPDERPLLRSLVIDALERHVEGEQGAVGFVQEQLRDKTQMVVARWKLVLNQLSLSASSYTNSTNIRRFQDTKESRVTNQASSQWSIAANVSTVYDSSSIAWENNLRLVYAKMIARNDTTGNGIPNETISQETADDIVLTTEVRINQWQFMLRNDSMRVVPFIDGVYDTEFTPTPGNPRQKLGRAILGFVAFPGPRWREVRLGFMIQEDFSAQETARRVGLDPHRNYGTNYGIAAGYRVIAPIYQTMRLESSLDLRYQFADQAELPSDLSVYAWEQARLLWPFFQQRLSMFVAADIVVVRGKSNHVNVGTMDAPVYVSNRQFGGSWILSVGLDFSGIFRL